MISIPSTKATLEMQIRLPRFDQIDAEYQPVIDAIAQEDMIPITFADILSSYALYSHWMTEVRLQHLHVKNKESMVKLKMDNLYVLVN